MINTAFRFLLLLTIGLLSVAGCEINVTDDTNSQPIIDRVIVPDKVKVGEMVKLEIIAYDPDGDELVYNWQVSAGMVDAAGVWTVPAEATNATVLVHVSDRVNTSVTSSKINVEIVNEWLGTWAIESFDGETIESWMFDSEQTLAEMDELGIDVSAANSWTFNEDGTMEWELGFKFEAKGEGFEISEPGLMNIRGTYSLSGSNYILTFTEIEATGFFEEFAEEELRPIDPTDEDTGTWSRSGDTLTLNNDDGIRIVLKKR